MQPAFTNPRTSTLTSALKEWAVAIDALTQGETILLLRKGGIREPKGRFTIPQRQIWLYPTYEHQQPHLLKPTYADRVQPVPSGWHPETVTIPAWADITDVLEISDADPIASLAPFHIWNETFITERLKWQPRSPLSLLLLRVYRLPQPQPLPYRSEYGGCRSWLELPEMAEVRGAAVGEPVLSDDSYFEQVQAIGDLVNR